MELIKKDTAIITVEEYNALPMSKMGFKTRVTIENEKGEIEVQDHNATMLMGRLFALETAFKPTIDHTQHYTLNDDKNIHPAEEGSFQTDQDWYNRKVGYFGVGVGGIKPMNPLTLYEPHNYETILYDHVPIRCVTVDLSTEDKANYRLRKVINIEGTDYICYFLKTFDAGNVFMLRHDGQVYTPDVAHSVPYEVGHPLEDTSILTYQKFQLFISGSDFKEYYKATHDDSLADAKISELAICMGNDISVAPVGEATAFTEVVNTELFGKIVHSPTYMDQEENSKIVTYEVFT